MKKILALVLAVVFVLALFAACGNTPSTPATPDTPSNPSTPDTPSTPSTPDAPIDSGLPYKVDDLGIPMEPYDYELPLTTEDDDTVLSYWWCTYTPQYIPDGQEYGDTPLPQEVLRRTGVHVEYINVPSTSRQDTFGVLVASDDLCDIMSCANYYPGGTLKMVEDGYFVNIYDHIEWMPNYLYRGKWEHPEDVATYESVYYNDTMVPLAHVLWDDHVVTDSGFCVRQDWLDKFNMKADDLKTWDDFTEAMRLVKSEIDTCEFPLWLAEMIEISGYWEFNSYENLCLLFSALPPLYFRDGQLVLGCTSEGDKQFAQQLNYYYTEKLLNQDWQSYFYAQVFKNHSLNNETFWQSVGATSVVDYNVNSTDPNCNWVPVGKPLVTEDQVVHAGTLRSRATTGNCGFATKNKNLELAMKWIDYRYSPAGWELFAYGPDGVVVEKDENGNRKNTEWSLSEPDGYDLSALVSIYTSSRMVEPGICVSDAALLNPGGQRALAACDYWTAFDDAHYDKAGALPIGVRLDTEQAEEVAKYRTDIATFIVENYGGFIVGSKSFDEWDAYQATLDQLGRQEILAVYQEAYDDYMARKAG